MTQRHVLAPLYQSDRRTLPESEIMAIPSAKYDAETDSWNVWHRDGSIETFRRV